MDFREESSLPSVVILASNCDILPSVVVEITPSYRPVKERKQPDVDLREHVLTIVTIKPGQAAVVIRDEYRTAGHQKVQIPVVVKIRPIRPAIRQGGKTETQIDEASFTVVAPELALRFRGQE